MSALAENYLALAVGLIALGMVGVIARRNLFVVYLSVELMLNGVNLILATFSRLRPEMGGASIALIMIGVVAAEAALFLAMLAHLWRSRRSLDAERYRDLAQERWS